MRDPVRISRMLTALEHYWRRYPDLRLAQIVCNFAQRPGLPSDPYHYEDDALIADLEAAMWLEPHGATPSSDDPGRTPKAGERA